MPRNPKIPANDDGDSPKISIDIPESTPLGVIEVEIFDALISNISALVANDNDPPSNKEKAP